MRNSAWLFRVGLLAGVIAAGCSPAMAAVRWVGTVAELAVVVGQEKAVAEFVFRNEGTRPLRFVTLRPSCDCLTAQGQQGGVCAR